jgi:signal transduction histidine kinase
LTVTEQVRELKPIFSLSKTVENNWLQWLSGRSRAFFVVVCLGFAALIGSVDFVTGFEMFFSIFYLFGIGVATWFVGAPFGLFMAVLSAAACFIGDFAAGARYSKMFIPIWNTGILLAFYSSVIWLLLQLRSLKDELESRVEARTLSLKQEMAERARLEKEILEISEREQRRIGHDLHDSLCQHLTATAMAGKVLEEKLNGKLLTDAAVDAAKVVELIENGIELARNFARGISPVELEAEGLISAFHELASNIMRLSRVKCFFESDPKVHVQNPFTATHLYRIGQEAINNAIRHGKASRIDISLLSNDGEITLSIEDNGIGLPETRPLNHGLGTRIMAHRAGMIGGSFSVEPNPTGGTLVRCVLPLYAESTRNEFDLRDAKNISSR